jgi:hypothetical protein
MPLISIKCGRRTCMVRKFVWRENLAVIAEEGGRDPPILEEDGETDARCLP